MDPHELSFPSKPPVSAYFATAFFAGVSLASFFSSSFLTSLGAGAAPLTFLAGYFNASVGFLAGFSVYTEVGAGVLASTGGPYAFNASVEGDAFSGSFNWANIPQS